MRSAFKPNLATARKRRATADLGADQADATPAATAAAHSQAAEDSVAVAAVSAPSPAAAPAVAPSSAAASATPAGSAASSVCSSCGAVGSLHFESSVGSCICTSCGHADSRSTSQAFDDDGESGPIVDDVMWDGARRQHVTNGSFVRAEGARTMLSESAIHTYGGGGAGGGSISNLFASAAASDPDVRHSLARVKQRRRAAAIMDTLKIPPSWKPQLYALLEQAAKVAGEAASSDNHKERAEEEQEDEAEEPSDSTPPAVATSPRTLAAAASTSAASVPSSSPSLRFAGGRSGGLLIGSCLYFLCRSRGRALSMLDVSDGLGVNVFDFGRAFSRVSECLGWASSDRGASSLRTVDPAIFVEKIIAAVAEAQNNSRDKLDREDKKNKNKRRKTNKRDDDPAASPLDSFPASDQLLLTPDLRLQVRRDANALLVLAHRTSLDGGRSPAGLAGAAVYLSLRSCLSSLSSFSASASSSSSASFLECIGLSLKIHPRTIEQRMRELKAALFTWLQTALPWLAQEARNAKQGLDKHIPFIMQHLTDIMQAQEPEREEQKQQPNTQSANSSAAAPTVPPLPLSVLHSRVPAPSDPPCFHRSFARRLDRLRRIAHAAARIHLASAGRLHVEHQAVLDEIAAATTATATNPSPPTAADNKLNSTASYSSVPLFDGSASSSKSASLPPASPLPSPTVSPSLDLHPDDLLLERLLLSGVPALELADESNLLGRAQVDAASKSQQVGVAGINAPLSDADLSLEEIQLYVRTSAERQQWQALQAQQQAIE